LVLFVGLLLIAPQDTTTPSIPRNDKEKIPSNKTDFLIESGNLFQKNIKEI
jgi:hypothetical protein